MAKGGLHVFQRYKADDDPDFFEWQKKTFTQLMHDFYAYRDLLNAYLASLTGEQLKGTGRHPVYGLMSIEGWAEFFLLHEAHHLFTITKLAAIIDTNRIVGV